MNFSHGMARPFMFATLCQRAQPLKHSLAESKNRENLLQPKNSLAGSLVRRGITVLVLYNNFYQWINCNLFMWCHCFFAPFFIYVVSSFSIVIVLFVVVLILLLAAGLLTSSVINKYVNKLSRHDHYQRRRHHHHHHYTTLQVIHFMGEK